MTISDIKTVAVAGGSGGIGELIVKALLAAGFSVRILTRPESTKADVLAQLAAAGATINAVDAKDADALAAALRGVDAVVSTYGGAALGDQFALVKAAAAAGVRRFIPSDFGADPASIKTPRALFTLKDDVAAAATAAGLETTRIYTGFFSDTTFYAWCNLDLASGKVLVPGDGTSRITFTHRADIAKFIAAALSNPGASKNAELRIATDTLTLNELLAKARVLQPNLVAEYEPLDAIAAKIAADPNPWGTVVDQLRFALGNNEAVITRKPDTDVFKVDAPITIDAQLVTLLGKK